MPGEAVREFCMQPAGPGFWGKESKPKMGWRIATGAA